MKANEAPEKIYILKHTDYSDRRILNAFTEKENNNDIEYIRTDVFIEKVCRFLDDRIKHDSIDYPMVTVHLIEDFKNYVKGE